MTEKDQTQSSDQQPSDATTPASAASDPNESATTNAPEANVASDDSASATESPTANSKPEAEPEPATTAESTSQSATSETGEQAAATSEQDAATPATSETSAPAKPIAETPKSKPKPQDQEQDQAPSTPVTDANTESADQATTPANQPATQPTEQPPKQSPEQPGVKSAEATPAETASAEPEPKPEIELIAFKTLDLAPELQQGIDGMGFTMATPIQSLTLPHSLTGKDVIGKAQTGTGKTAAFLITVINRLLKEPEQEERYNGEPRALILAPTRELALQIEKDAQALIEHTPLQLMSVVGGMDYQKQQRRLQQEILDIIVGTPGRLIDFVRNRDLFLSETEVLVIDEADRMLDMGFIPDVKRLIRETPFKEYRQTLLFSATFTQDILNLSASWTRSAEYLEVESDTAAADTVDQKIYIVTTDQKFTLLYNLIQQNHLERIMVFANRRDETRDLTDKLKAYGIECALLSGDVAQQKRIKVLENFRTGKIQVLVATDVAGRGIHIDDITHVVNYTLPEDPEDYVHRIGRTGRAGKDGTSISFACEEDAFQLPAIESLLGDKLECVQPDESLLSELPPPPNPINKSARSRNQGNSGGGNGGNRRPRRGGGNRRSRGPRKSN